MINIKIVLFVYLNLFFLFGILNDVKKRKISNKAFLYVFIITGLLLLLEMLYRDYYLLYIIFLKIPELFIVFFICLLLFSAKLIGGSDGKAILLIFLSIPPTRITYLTFSLFFIIFFGYFAILIGIQNIINHFSSCTEDFSLLFYARKINSCSERVFLYSFFRFQGALEIKNTLNDKYQIKDNSLYFNTKRERLEVFIQLRPPLFIIIYFAYLTIFLLI